MSLEHPNVVPIYDAGDVDGRVYLAMRLVDGSDLGSLLRAEGALEPARAIAICAQIAAALDAAHAQRSRAPRRQAVQRPARRLGARLPRRLRAHAAARRRGRRRRRGLSIGTPAYLAPEQLDRAPIDGSADVYSLGCVLYECLTGAPVFPRSSRLAVAWAHLEEEPPKPSRQRVGLPEAIDAVIERALAKEPERRYPSCGALVAAAGQALGLGTPRASRRRRTLLLAGAAALAIGAAAAVIATSLAHGAHKSPPALRRSERARANRSDDQEGRRRSQRGAESGRERRQRPTGLGLQRRERDDLRDRHANEPRDRKDLGLAASTRRMLRPLRRAGPGRRCVRRVVRQGRPGPPAVPRAPSARRPKAESARVPAPHHTDRGGGGRRLRLGRRPHAARRRSYCASIRPTGA